MSVKIKDVEKDSVCYKKISAGDTLVAVNSHEINDVLDYRFYTSACKLKLEIENEKGKRRTVKIKKGEYDEWVSRFPGKVRKLVLIGQTAGNFEFALEMDAADMTALGLSATPQIKNGKIEVNCSKTGAGKIFLTSSVGAKDQFEGLDFHQEISIVSRPAVASNGGWL